MYKIILIVVSNVAFLLLSSCWCENSVYNRSWRIWVKNNSDKNVYCVLGFNHIDNDFYPTTKLPNDSTKIWCINPQSIHPLDYSLDHNKFNQSDSIALFVFDPDTLAKYTWKQLGVGEKYLKKYGFKCNELTANPDRPINYP